MVDDQPTGGPEPDDDTPVDDTLRSADGTTAPDEPWVRDLLADLDFLRPYSAEAADAVSLQGSEPMPPWVWARVSAALAAESGTTRRRPAWVRWGGGLVAASVAVLAIGIAVTSFSGGTSTPDENQAAVLAGTAPETAARQDGPPAAAPKLQAPTTLSFAGMVPPALRLTDSQTDYTAEGLRGQIAEVLQRMDMAPQEARAAMEQAPVELVVPDPEPPLLLQSPASLRACITKLTRLATSTALLIDWSTFQGEEAGVIVTPEYPDTGQSVPDVTELDVWVVDHECDVRTEIHIEMR